MMARKLEEGWDRLQAATFAYRATAFPMLTGTLSTILGFLPVGLAKSSAGEYTAAIFQVVGISLILSWLGAVTFTPYLGYLILKPKPASPDKHRDLYDSVFYTRLRHWVIVCLTHRNKVIAATILLFAFGVWTLTKLPQQFFPLSNRPELIVDLWSPEGSAFEQSEAVAKRMEAVFAKDPDIVHYASYIGEGTPRFFLLIVQQLANTNLVEFVLMTKNNAAREQVMQRIRQAIATDFPEVRGRIMRLNIGPPMDYPVLFRVFGDHAETVRSIADRVTDIVRANPHTVDVNDDWHENRPSILLELDQAGRVLLAFPQ